MSDLQTLSENDALLELPEKLLVLLKPKRFKILIGGRGGSKSESVAQILIGTVHEAGGNAVCCREFQNSIKQSVHSLMTRMIKRLDLVEYFDPLKTEIRHILNESLITYQGLARDPQAVKSIDDVRNCWVEEAQSISEESLRELTPSIRGAGSEIWMTANLRASNDVFTRRFFKPFEKQLRANGGVYEDDLHTIVWINYQDNPWFPPELEQERVFDKENLSSAEYAHKWDGECLDTVEDAIIKPEWFDACVDAHIKLGIEPRGVEVVAHDPSDTGPDSKGLAYRHGILIKDAIEKDCGDINEGGDWAQKYCEEKKPDWFIWDGDGMGVGLRRQFSDGLGDKNIKLEMFRGSHSPDLPDEVYEEGKDETAKKKTNKQTFRNKRAQYYWELRDRCYRTYKAVQQAEKGGAVVVDPDELISFSSEIKALDLLRAEICQVPLSKRGRAMGLIQIMTKDEMRALGIASPNLSDSVMMCLANPPIDVDDWNTELNYPDLGII